MSPYLIILTLVSYIAVMFFLAYRCGRRADNEGFFIGGRRTSWYMATLAMIGAAMSGVTFISVPGSVAADGMSYMQMVIGFTIGQFLLAFWLVPVFYKRGVVSLYEYLDERFGVQAHRAGAWCFLVAKLIGAALKIHVIFPGGMILEDNGEVKIYYGASDTVECLATAKLEDLIALCTESR